MTCESTFPSMLRKSVLLLFCLCLFYTGHAQTQTAQGGTSAIPITYSAKRTTLKDVFEHIIKETGVTLWYPEEVGQRETRDVSFKNTPLRSVLDKLLPKDLYWKFKGKEILILKKGISESSVADPKDNTPSKPGLPALPVDVDIDVTGRVVDENGNPIPGATILIKGHNKGTITDGNGNFRLQGVPENAVLTISNVSFLTKEHPVKGSAVLGAITLKQLEKKLDDVVILAYSKTTNRLLTGNVSSVKAKDIQNSPVNNPILAVAGRVPGIVINQSSGFAGSGVDIQIQGMNSFFNGTAPFIVIDGIPYPQSLLPNLANVQKFSGRGSGGGPTNGNPLSYINTADIESIEILKDADATAIYGSRAANGAIIITTKRGKEGQMRVDANLQTGFGKVAKRLKLLDTRDYLTIRKEAFNNDNRMPGSRDYDLNGTWDTTRSADWQKELIGGKAKYTEVQLSVSGGSPYVQYAVSGNYHRETTVLPTDLSNSKISTRFNIDGQSKNRRLRVNFSGSYLSDNNRLPVTDLTSQAMSLAPVFPRLRNADGSLNWAPNANGISTITNHPLASLTQYYTNQTNNLLGNLSIQYNVFGGLDVKLTSGYNKLHTDEISTRPSSSMNPERRSTFIRGADFGYNDISSWIVEPQLLYKSKIAKGDLNALVGMSFQEMNSNRRQITATGFSNDDVMENISAATTLTSSQASSIVSQYKYNAVFAQLNYNWANKYIINLSGRRDGSSRFGADNKFHNFYGTGIAWVFSEEQFAKNFSETIGNVITYGKVKFSYGTTGNDQIGDYNYLSLYQNNSFGIPYRGINSLTINRIANEALQWEETKKLSLGLDLGFINDRILINSAYYRNRSSNMLLPGDIPSTAGPINGLTVNLPLIIQNSGFEVAVTTINLKRSNFNWSSGFNFTIPKNQIIAYRPGADNYTKSTTIGYPINVVRLYRSAGVNSETGKYQFYDKDGKIIDNPTTDPLNNTKFINPNEKFYGGLTNTLTYKGITLDILISFVKRMGRNEPLSIPPGYTINNQQSRVLDRWTKEGDVAPFQKLTMSDFGLYFPFFYQLSSDAYWEDASYVRFKNVSISYSFPEKLLRAAKLQGGRVFLNAQNVLTITSYRGLDPETLSNVSLPPLKVVTAGIQVSL